MSETLRFTVDVTPKTLAGLDGWEQVRKPARRRLRAVATDTRRDPLAGAIFIALDGANHDGHRYVREAVKGGAAAVVVTRVPRNVPADVGVYRVADTRRALADLAVLKRKAFSKPVIAITGSAGKTSTKSFLGTLMGPGTYVNPGNWNNEVGVPLSILAAPADATGWVLELGMNHAGEIATLTDIVRPDLGVLLPAGNAHVGNLGSPEAVLEAKAELATAEGAPARLVVADRRYLKPVGRERCVLVGRGKASNVQIASARTNFPEGTTMTLVAGKRRYLLHTPLMGAHWSLAVAAAWSAAREIGLKPATLARRAKQLYAPAGRMQLIAYRGGWILDDSYNASPESYLALLDAVRPWARRLELRLLVGDMRELGRASTTWHEAIAQSVAALGPAHTVAVGRAMARALKAAGVDTQGATSGAAGLRRAVADWRPGTLLVAKGANATGIYTALAELKEDLCSTS